MNELIKNLPIENELLSFEKNLSKVIDGCNIFLKKDLKSFIFAPSKRLRPGLIFLVSNVLDIKNKNVEYLATSIELIHSASLLHDDIIDNETSRRQNIPFYKTFGNKKAILMGDLLLSLALKELSKTNIKIIKTVTDKIQSTILGELNQNKEIGNIITVEKYLEKTFNKTGNLFMAGVEGLFDIKKVDSEIKKALINYTYNFSLAFQIKNDIDNIIKKDMSDIKNGNYTLPVIYFFMENLNLDLKNITKNDLEKYILKANNQVKDFKKKAIDSLKIIENSIYKQGLIDLLETF